MSQLHDLACFVLVGMTCQSVDGFIKALARRDIISSRAARKLMHIGMGPVFLCCWAIFSPSPLARFYCAIIPLVFSLKFFTIGAGILRDPDTVKTMSRSGAPGELLRGPVQYGLVFTITTFLCWRSPWAVVSLMTLCFGDGFAEVFGESLLLSCFSFCSVLLGGGDFFFFFVVASCLGALEVVLSLLFVPYFPLFWDFCLTVFFAFRLFLS
jgi:hypothetical protein